MKTSFNVETCSLTANAEEVFLMWSFWLCRVSDLRCIYKVRQFSVYPVSVLKRKACTGVCCPWLRPFPPWPPRPWISLDAWICLLLRGQDRPIWCPCFTILACFAGSVPLRLTQQEMAPLSLGEEVAFSRPLACRIDGDCGNLLIIPCCR